MPTLILLHETDSDLIVIVKCLYGLSLFTKAKYSFQVTYLFQITLINSISYIETTILITTKPFLLITIAVVKIFQDKQHSFMGELITGKLIYLARYHIRLTSKPCLYHSRQKAAQCITTFPMTHWVGNVEVKQDMASTFLAFKTSLKNYLT